MGDHPGHVPLKILLDDEVLETRSDAVSNISTTIQLVGFNMVDLSAQRRIEFKLAEIRPHGKPVERPKTNREVLQDLAFAAPIASWGRYSTMIGPRITSLAGGAQ